MTTQVGVLGAGSIGAYLGGRLAAAQVPVVMVGRPRLRDAVDRGGLHLSATGRAPVQVPAAAVRMTTDVQVLADCDLVLVTVKSRDTEAAARQLDPHLKPGATVVSLQNGVRNTATLQAALPGVRIAAGMVSFNVAWTEGPRFHQGTSGPVVVDPAAAALVPLLVDAGIAAQTHRDLPAVQWGKLLINLNNAVNALAGVPLQVQLRQRAYRQVMADLIAEALTVLEKTSTRAVGLGPVQPWLVPRVLRLPQWLYAPIANSLVKVDPEARSSMWDDLERRRPTEVDWINGEIVELARKAGVDAPYNRAIQALIHDAVAADSGSPKLSAAALRAALS